MSESDDDAAFASADEGEVSPAAEASTSAKKSEAASTKISETGVKSKSSEALVKSSETEQTPKKNTTGNKGDKKGKKQKGKKKNTGTTEPSSAKTKVSDKSASSENKGSGDSEEKVSQQQGDVKSSGTDETEKSLVLDSDKLTEVGEKPKESIVKTDIAGKDDGMKEDSKSEKLSGDSDKGKIGSQREVVSQSSNSDVTDEPEKKDVKEDHPSAPNSALDRLTEPEDKGGWGGWGSWGSKLVNVASTSVSTFGNQLGEGFTTIMDTVETTLGAPTAEEMAAGNLKEAPPTEDIPRGPETSEEEPSSKSSDSDNTTDKDSGSSPAESIKEEAPPIASKEEDPPTASGGGGGGWFSGWGVSSLSSVMQNTTNMSKHLVTGSLDVLETIGKKTFDVIKEHDPVLRKTREVFLFDKGDKPNLSQVLRDAKKDSEAQVELEHQMEEARKVNFGAVFDEYQGLAHLEALEILSNQCEKRIQSLLSAMSEESLADIKSGLIDIKKVFEREEEEEDEVEQNQDFEKLVTEEISKLHLGTKPDKLTRTHKNIKEKLENCETGSDDTDRVKSLHQCAIQSLAELTSKSVEQFHKAGELVLLQRESIKTFLEKANHLQSLTRVLCTEVEIVSTKFCECLNKISKDLEDSKEVNPVLTNIYLEASNSSTYIQDAFQLMLPCLQQAAIESTADKS